MRLPARLLNASAQVLKAVKSPPDRLGQSTVTWQPDGTPLQCGDFPAGTRILEQAQLKGVKVSREVYLERPGLNLQTNRVRVDGVEYAIALVHEWDGFTVLGVNSV